MFYPVKLPPHSEDKKLARALVAFTPAESKRLIAKALAVLPEVRIFPPLMLLQAAATRSHLPNC